jgi:uncharacterized membrane protein
MTVCAGCSSAFSVNVSAPLFSTSATHSFSISATAINQSGADEVVELTLSARIVQYSQVRSEIAETLVQIDSSEQKSLSMTVYNDGNGHDMLLIELVNRQELEAAGFSVSLSSGNLQMLPHSNSSIDVEILAPNPEGVGSDQYDLQLKVTSQYSMQIEGYPNHRTQNLAIVLNDNVSASQTDLSSNVDMSLVLSASFFSLIAGVGIGMVIGRARGSSSSEED